MARKLYPGVYGPLPTFFDHGGELDLVSYKSHLLSMSEYAVLEHFTNPAKILHQKALVCICESVIVFRF